MQLNDNLKNNKILNKKKMVIVIRKNAVKIYVFANFFFYIFISSLKLVKDNDDDDIVSPSHFYFCDMDTTGDCFYFGKNISSSRNNF